MTILLTTLLLMSELPPELAAKIDERVQSAIESVQAPSASIAVVLNGKKLIRGPEGETTIYDLTRDPGEQAGLVHPDQREPFAALADDVHLVGVRAQHPHDGAVVMGVRAEHRVGVVMGPAEQPVDRLRVGRAGVDRLGRVLVAIHAGTLLLPGGERPVRGGGIYGWRLL